MSSSNSEVEQSTQEVSNEISFNEEACGEGQSSPPQQTQTTEAADNSESPPTAADHQDSAGFAEGDPHQSDVKSSPQDTETDNAGERGADGGSGDSESALEPEQVRKIFVGGLNYRTTEESLRNHFAQCGKILDCIVMFDQSGRSRGFGFVTFMSSAVVDKVMNQRPHMIDGREVDVKRATPKERHDGYEEQNPKATYYQQYQKASVKKIFIGAIREGIDEDDLRSYFSAYGNVVDCIIMRDSDRRLRGFGFLEFDDCDPVDKVVLERHHVIKGKTVDVKKAVPRTSSSSDHGSSFNQQQTNRYAPYGGNSGQYSSYNGSFRYRGQASGYGSSGYQRSGTTNSHFHGRDAGGHHGSYYSGPSQHVAAAGGNHWNAYGSNPQQFGGDYGGSAGSYGTDLQGHGYSGEPGYGDGQFQAGADYWSQQNSFAGGQGYNNPVEYSANAGEYGPGANTFSSYGQYPGGDGADDGHQYSAAGSYGDYTGAYPTQDGGNAPMDGSYYYAGGVGGPAGPPAVAGGAPQYYTSTTYGTADGAAYAQPPYAPNAYGYGGNQPSDPSAYQAASGATPNASAGGQYMTTYGTYATSHSVMGTGAR